MKVITRFPPSPTGYFHVGSVRTALFNYLFAKHHGGTFLLRFEDTDKERSRREFEENILDGLRWLKILPDNKEIPRQSERGEVYQSALEKLIALGHAHEAEESKAGGGRVVRFKNPNTRITFRDEIRGDVSFDTAELGDFVIARSLKEPLYHLSVVVDDAEAGVTHIIRGDDHISNTPRQILILEALGAHRPVYAHLPLILAPDRSKLSKRHGAAPVNEYREMGFLPEALVNFLALLGWNPGGDQEFFSMEELVVAFDLTKVQKGGAVFDIQKLKAMNRRYIKKLPPDVFVRGVERHIPDSLKQMPLYSEDAIKKLAPILAERIDTFGEVKGIAEAGELDYFFDIPILSKDILPWKDTTQETAQQHLMWIVETLKKLPDDSYDAEDVKRALWEYATKNGRGEVLWPLRYALSGRDKSPDPFTLAGFFGKTESIKRIARAIELQNHHA